MLSGSKDCLPAAAAGHYDFPGGLQLGRKLPHSEPHPDIGAGIRSETDTLQAK